MQPRHSLLLVLATLLGACNMVMSDTPMFSDEDRGSVLPRDGLWLGEDAECGFDSSVPDADWPQCALWVVVRENGAEMLMKDGKGQSERIRALFAAGKPAIVQAEWIDDAKEPEKAYYSFFGLEPLDAGSGDLFSAAVVWPVECGIQDTPNGDIRPFPGISRECRPSSRDAVRSAATASRETAEIKTWRWIRPESP